jgi:hypothetical protein
MRWERVVAYWSVGGLAGGVLAVSVWAQTPVPPTGPAAATCDTCGRSAPLHRGLRHAFHVLQDNMIGYPAEFVEPPLGFFVNQHRDLMRAKADPHRFTLYQTDFLEGTNRLSPVGASRFNLMATRLASWPGPVIVEWSPDKPGVAESRRQAVLALLERTGLPVVPERVVIGPSPYPGMLGTNAADSYKSMIEGGTSFPTSYQTTKSVTAAVSTTTSGSH